MVIGVIVDRVQNRVFNLFAILPVLGTRLDQAMRYGVLLYVAPLSLTYSKSGTGSYIRFQRPMKAAQADSEKVAALQPTSFNKYG